MTLNLQNCEQIVFRGKSGKRDLTFHDERGREMAHNLVDELDLEKPWDITIKPYRKQRTLPQNALLHKWIGLLAEFTGDTQESMKSDLKTEFAEIVESRITPGEFRPMDTSEMDTLQMSEFMNRIYAWATTEMGLILPVPPREEAA